VRCQDGYFPQSGGHARTRGKRDFQKKLRFDNESKVKSRLWADVLRLGEGLKPGFIKGDGVMCRERDPLDVSYLQCMILQGDEGVDFQRMRSK